MDCNSPFPNARTAGLFRPDPRAPPAPASHASSARPARERLEHQPLQSCAPNEYLKPHRSSPSSPPPPSLLFLTPLPAAPAQSVNPYSCGTASASSRALVDRARQSPRNSPPRRKNRMDGVAEHRPGAAPRTSNRHHGPRVLAAPRTHRISDLAAAFLRINETAAANSPCPARETPAAHPARTSSPAVPQFPPARQLRSPTAPPNLFDAAPPASRSLPSNCALLLLPDKDCCCA